jgi:tetratricopeptide (TPR) repeat protein
MSSYLWEKEQPSLAKDFFLFGLRFDDGNPANEVFTHAHRLLGNIYLDLAKPHAALEAHMKNIKLRESVDGPNTPPIAEACDSIACAYTEAGDTGQAFIWLDKATAIHKAHPPGHPARTAAIRSMTCLRASDAEGALDALRECWQLQGMTQDDIEKSKYPKHSGDIMLLARIFWIQGKKREAQELVSRTVTMRRGVFGENGGPRVGDSLFTLARMLEDGNELALGLKLLKQVTTMSDGIQEMTTHLARALWFSANIEAKLGSEEDIVLDLRRKARDARLLIEGREWPDEDTDESFVRLVGWMLW